MGGAQPLEGDERLVDPAVEEIGDEQPDRDHAEEHHQRLQQVCPADPP